MNIFIGLGETAGYNHNLCNGFKNNGLNAIFLNIEPNAFSYKNDSEKYYNFLFKGLCFARKRGLKSTSIFKKIFFYFLTHFFKFFVFIYSLFKYDVFIFGGGTSFYGKSLDLPIIKFFGKKIICIFYGSESRPPYINGKYYTESEELVIYLTKKIKKNIKRIERYANYLITHSPSSQLFEKKIIPFLVMGLPYSSISTLEDSNLYEKEKKIRILHAPTHPMKGSVAIKSIVQQLKEKGFDIEYVEIVNKPNSVVLEEIKKCDLVLDELYSDSFMAGLGTEAASFGKPTLVSGYVTVSDLANPDSFVLSPVHHCKPENLKDELEKIIQDKVYLKDLGKQAYEFVQNNWNANIVAQKYISLINNNFPSNWILDPHTINYINGYGLSKEQLSFFIKRILNKGGMQALQLSDKPHLEKTFLNIVQ